MSELLRRGRCLPRGTSLAAAALLLACAAAQAQDNQTDTKVAPPVGAETSTFGNYLAGRYAQATGDIAAASEFISATLANDPKSLELLQRAFLLRLTLGDMTGALDAAARLQQVEEGPSSVGTFMAAQALKAGDYAAAERYAGTVPAGGANRFIVPLLKAWARSGAGNLDGALQALSPLEHVEGFGAVYYMQRGLMYDLGGKRDEAEHDFVKALEIAGEPPLRLVQALGNLYARAGRTADARATYQRFVDDNPDSRVLQPDIDALQSPTAPAPLVGSAREGLAEAMFGLSTILLHEEAADIALLYDRLALDLKPDHLLAQVLLGDILRQQDRLADAITAYRVVPADTPYGWAARLSIADSLDQLGQTDEAEKLLRAMIDEAPERYDAASMLGNMLRSKERFADAAAAYDIAVARHGELKEKDWSLLYFRGISYERSDQWPKAEADFQKALELEADQPFVLNYLAYSWIEKGQHFDDALKMLGKAVEQRPNDGYIVDSLGWVYFRLGRFDDAVTQLERAVGLKPVDPVLNDHLGDAYWRVGRKLEARYQWRRALQFKPEADQVGLIQSKIEHGLATTTEAPGSGG